MGFGDTKFPIRLEQGAPKRQQRISAKKNSKDRRHRSCWLYFCEF